MNFPKANQIKKKVPYFCQEDKINPKRLKSRETAPTYKFENINTRLNL